MNYSTDNFVIDVGQYIPTIMFRAPLINGSPINHEQTYCIFAAIHDEIFNEIFPWASINNGIEQALTKVYPGYDLFGVGQPTYWKYGALGYELFTPGNAPFNYVEIKPGHGLPSKPPANTICKRPGVRVYAEWLNAFVNTVLAGIHNRLRDEIYRFVGTAANYEWHFEYVTNGIFYTKASKEPLNILQGQPVIALTDEEKAQQAILELPVIQPRQQLRNEFVVNVDIRSHSSDELMRDVYLSAQQMLSQRQVLGTRLTFNITYHAKGYYDKLEKFIRQCIEMNNLDVQVSFVQNWIDPIKTKANTPQQERMLVSSYLSDLKDIAKDLDRVNELRTQIIRNNEVAQWQCKELILIAPEIFSKRISNEELAMAVNMTDWGTDLRGHRIDALSLSAVVVGVVVAIDRYLKALQDSETLPVQSTPDHRLHVLQEINWNNVR